MNDIKPIETIYHGYRFRSRLEARWAVFFSRLGLRWEYEPEGYTLPDGTLYLPDFRVYTPQGSPCVYEIKPVVGGDDTKFESFRKASNAKVERSDWRVGTDNPLLRYCLLRGDPVDHIKILKQAADMPILCVCPRCGGLQPVDVLFWPEVKDRWCEEVGINCWPCDVETPCGGDQPEERGMRHYFVRPHKGAVIMHPLAYRRFASWITHAALEARQARFEHGQVPA